jgi:hypothetical protein
METTSADVPGVSSIAVRSALASGVIGLLAAIFALSAAELRVLRLISGSTTRFLFASHDVATVFQSLLLLPAVYVLYTRYREQHQSLSGIVTVIAAAALCAIALVQSLWLAGVMPETVYMLPQGIVGLWLIAANTSRWRNLPARESLIGTLGGVGLVMIAVSFMTLISYFGFQALTSRIDLSSPQAQFVNQALHVNLHVASWVGKPLYPVWVLLVARRLRAL